MLINYNKIKKFNINQYTSIVVTDIFTYYFRSFKLLCTYLLSLSNELFYEEVVVEVGRVWLELPSPIILLNQIQTVLGNPIQLEL